MGAAPISNADGAQIYSAEPDQAREGARKWILEIDHAVEHVMTKEAAHEELARYWEAELKNTTNERVEAETKLREHIARGGSDKERVEFEKRIAELRGQEVTQGKGRLQYENMAKGAKNKEESLKKDRHQLDKFFRGKP